MSNKIIESREGSPVVSFAALIIIFAGLIYSKSFITPFLLALFISIVCAQPISWLVKKRMPRWLALIFVILGMFVLFSGFAFLIGNTLSSFSGNLSKYESTLTTISNAFIQYLNENGINIHQDKISTLVQPAKILELTANTLNKLFNMVGDTFLIFLTILFILMEFESFSVKAKAIMSEPGKAISYFTVILQNVRNYLIIKSLLCVLVGILIYLALMIVGVDYPLLWAMIAGLMNFIPNIGSIISMIPTVLFALGQLGSGGALWTLGLSMLIHFVIGYLVEPRIMGKGLGLSTLVVFLSLLFWGLILGIGGMFLSVPITMTIKIIMEQNEKTKWVAILLGTPAEAKANLENRELIEEQQYKK
jgi:predicted PurR-regulated permease PerM